MTLGQPAAADVLVIGAGPAGAAAAIELARAGARVVLVDRDDDDDAPRGIRLLTPTARAALSRLGVTSNVHPISSIRWTRGSASSTTKWPRHREGSAGAIDRSELRHQLLRLATEAGATLLTRHTAAGPLVERGFVRGAVLVDPDGTEFPARAAYTVVADGANSRFGRSLGSYREPSWPYALAHSAICRSPRASSTEAEFVVGLTDRAGTPLTGYGWMVPGGEGLVSVGLMVMSTSPSFRVIKPTLILDRLIDEQTDRWQLGPATSSHGGRIPLGLSVGPVANATTLLVGDAAGVANPWSGIGIDAALDSGVIAADVLVDALDTGVAAVLQHYPHRLAEHYGSYYKVGRLASRIVGSPILLSRLGRWAAGNGRVARSVVRLTSNDLRPGRWGLAETAYRTGRLLSLVAPDA